MGRHVNAVVSRQALLHNLQQVRKMAPGSKIIAMVKANAYGHGLRNVSNIIQDTDALGVASIQEALAIREKGINTNIVLMEGIFYPDELALVQQYRFTMVVHHWLQIQAIKDDTQPLKQKYKVWLKINTGMNRLGFQPHEFQDAYAMLSQNPRVELMGFMTHFGQADEQNNAVTERARDQFYHIVADLPGAKCLANSAGIMAWPKTHADWVRPGLMLYGASPFADKTGKDFNLLPAMTLRSEVIAIRELQKGEKVGYGGTWENKQEHSKIAIVSIGYGDGYPWHAKNGTPVLVNGERTGTVGRVSMDMLAVDISHLKTVKVGDPVTLWGEGLPIEEVARHAGTIPYELFCRFTERVTVQVAD